MNLKCPHCNAPTNRCYRAGEDPDLGTPTDLRDTDLPSSDLLAIDLQRPPVVAAPFWIGPGGSATTANRQLNVSIGGTDTCGITSGPLGAQLATSTFAGQSL